MLKRIFPLLCGLVLLCSFTVTAQQSCGTVTDYDGNSYKTVQIGSQCWMAENLRSTHYPDGVSIPEPGGKSSSPYCYPPEGYSSRVPQYGMLYNWPAVMYGQYSSDRNPSGVQGVCPNGWHLPSDAEWKQLFSYLGGQRKCVCGSLSSNIAKSLADTQLWEYTSNECSVGYKPEKNNASGFGARPAGTCSFHGIQISINGFASVASYWSCSNAHYYSIYSRSSEVLSYDPVLKDPYSCRSVRCIRN